MSNAIIPLDVKVPAHLAERLNQKTTALGTSIAGGISSGGGPRISIRGGRFRVVEEGAETVLPELVLNIVIVGANPRLSKLYYEKQYNQDNEPAMPDCYSFDGVKPHVGVLSAQNDICAGCPQNAWGSRITPQGVQIKACSDQKRLAVVASSDIGGTIFLVQVPPASLKNLNAYQKELKRRGIPPEVVITKMGFDEDASHPKLTFNFGAFMSAEQQAQADALFNSPSVTEVTGEADVAPDSAPIAVAALPAIPAPVKPHAPVIPAVVPAPAAPAMPSKFGGATATSYTAPAPAARPVARPKVVAAPVAQAVESTEADPLSNLDAEVQKLINSMSADDK